jgi:ubiquinone/menaquinone biosynthesis C-methylase UbiE
VNLPVGSKIEFLASDGVSLPQEANSADFVWSYEVFQHMPSHDIVMGNLREVQRILKPTGIGPRVSD